MTIYAAAMPSPNALRNLDLNLLPTLDALLRERNVTRAANVLGLSQPAVSAALRRLRRHFHDEILLRRGNSYELTPLALQLRLQTEVALVSVTRVFDSTPAFDPGSASREFTILSSDYATAIIGQHLSRHLAEVAPSIRLRLQQPGTKLMDDAAEVLRTVDGLFLPHGLISNFPHTDLYQDDWVCIVSEDNPEVGEELELNMLARMPWVVFYDLPTAFAPASRQLAMLGVEPRVEIAVDGFMTIPFLIAGTRRVAVLQRKLAERIAGATGTRVLPCPWDVVPLKEAFWWHPMHRSDPAHEWLRNLLQEIGAHIAAGRSPDDPLSLASPA